MKRPAYLLPAIFYMGLIYWMSCHPAPETFHRWPMYDGIKLVHLLEYGFLALLWHWGLSRGHHWTPRTTALIAILLTLAWGITDEIHQSFVPTRTGKVMDAVTDLIGATLAMGLATLFRAMKNKLCYKRA